MRHSFFELADNDMEQIHLMLSPLQPWSSANSLAFSILTSYTPWLVEMILVVRLLAVYPYSTTPKRLWFFIFIPLLLLKIARFVNMTVFTVEYVALLRSPSSGNPLSVSQVAWNSHPGPKIEWVIQVLDNSYAQCHLHFGLNHNCANIEHVLYYSLLAFKQGLTLLRECTLLTTAGVSTYPIFLG